ncbi:hypothetical protein EVAR_37279_1 [Eumeta japonica]|uniref:Uncharacterized protein n=1 Tax=Eumeta variegata TaxID=151549 RepID=A0A4C1WK89_EUMVA|nr:hypothetical protein EVAR_37279_1 [Eumeta japonica]
MEEYADTAMICKIKTMHKECTMQQVFRKKTRDIEEGQSYDYNFIYLSTTPINPVGRSKQFVAQTKSSTTYIFLVAYQLSPRERLPLTGRATPGINTCLEIYAPAVRQPAAPLTASALLAIHHGKKLAARPLQCLTESLLLKFIVFIFFSSLRYLDSDVETSYAEESTRKIKFLGRGKCSPNPNKYIVSG